MGDVRMALQDADLERIGRYVQSQLPGWLEAADRPLPTVPIVERLTRLEDAILSGQELMRSEFRAQRELMEQRFASMQKQMDERFTSVQKQMDERFAAVDRRFEAVDQRFESVQKQMDERFTSVQRQMDDRFTAVLREIEVRAAASDKRFDDMQANFARTQWLIGIGFVVLGSLVSVLHFLG